MEGREVLRSRAGWTRLCIIYSCVPWCDIMFLELRVYSLLSFACALKFSLTFPCYCFLDLFFLILEPIFGTVIPRPSERALFSWAKKWKLKYYIYMWSIVGEQWLKRTLLSDIVYFPIHTESSFIPQFILNHTHFPIVFKHHLKVLFLIPQHSVAWI